MRGITKLIERSTRESRKAIEQFVTTEEQLKKENEEISNTLNLIEEEAAKLQQLKTKGDLLHKENQGIIERIGEFVRGTNNGGGGRLINV